jgi:hypothetical protein
MPQRYALQMLYPFMGERVFQSKPDDRAALAETRPVPDLAPK